MIPATRRRRRNISGVTTAKGHLQVAQSPHDYYDPDEPLDVPSRPQYTPRQQNDRLLLPFPVFFGR